jgi:hypothetical protein
MQDKLIVAIRAPISEKPKVIQIQLIKVDQPRFNAPELLKLVTGAKE